MILTLVMSEDCSIFLFIEILWFRKIEEIHEIYMHIYKISY